MNEIWKDSRYRGVNSHTVVVAWAYELPEDHIQLDDQHDEAKWFSVRDPKLHRYIRQRLKNIPKINTKRI